MGDIMLGRTIGELIQSQGPSAPFIHVQDILHQADWVIANLECAITESPTPEQKRYLFAAPGDAAHGLAEAGINAVSLSNNHSMDFGARGLLDTMSALSLNGVHFFGVGQDEEQARTPLILRKNDVSIALLAYTDVPIEGSSNFDTHSWIADPYTPGLAWANKEDIVIDIINAKKQANHVIVYFHTGIENLDHATSWQNELAVAAIDAGATIILGAHPHRLQEIELYKDGLIVYSLGNFVFDEFDDIANRSAVLQVVLSEAGIITFDWYPMVLVHGIPQPADPGTAEMILSILDRKYTPQSTSDKH